MSSHFAYWCNDGDHDLEIAGFVQEGDPFVNKVVAGAAQVHLERTTANQHFSFASAVTDPEIDMRRAAIEAIYLQLAETYYVRYEFERGFDEASGLQFVRVPRVTGDELRGTCLDLSILLLSCIANIKLRPIYIHLHGDTDHALAGAWIRERGPDPHPFLSDVELNDAVKSGDLVVVESTGFAKGFPGRQNKLTFHEAVSEAESKLHDPEFRLRFALDVQRAWEQGISAIWSSPSATRERPVEYLLPLFVGTRAGTGDLDSAVRNVCQAVSSEQSPTKKRMLWAPRLIDWPDSRTRQSVLDTIRAGIREAALCIFDLSDPIRSDVLVELGIAMGIFPCGEIRNAIVGVSAHGTASNDWLGIPILRYRNERDLQHELRSILQTRLEQLQKPPRENQSNVYHKIQIDANWDYRIRSASKAIYFFAGDVSWSESLKGAIDDAIDRGVTVRVCCREPDADEKRKWQNIHSLKGLGVQMRILDGSLDPRIRGFITEPREMDETTNAMLVRKKVRNNENLEYISTGDTVGESRFLYEGRLLRGGEDAREITALVRLFECLWDDQRTSWRG